MACEYLANSLQAVSLNGPVIFSASIPCRRGFVYHDDETGVFVLRNPSNNCFATFQVTFNGNVAIPEGGTAGPIAVAIVVNGEQRPTSRAVYTPAAVDTYGNVTSTAIIKVPKGCGFPVSVESIPGTTDPTATPAPVIDVINANLVISRIA